MKQFTLQIATTREQSQRLITLGLKPETADMHYSEMPTIDAITDEVCNGINNDETESVLMPGRGFYTSFPAWSLSRLIEMLPSEIPDPRPGYDPHHPELIKHESGYNLSIRRYTADCLVGPHIENDPIECCISMIEWLIQKGHFDKEYSK